MYLALDKQRIEQRLCWKSELAPTEATDGLPKLSAHQLGVLAGVDLRDLDSTEVVVNKKVSVYLDCSVEPCAGLRSGQSIHHAHIAVNPALLDVAEVLAPTVVMPGMVRVRPVLHIRGLRKFNLSDFDWVASIHLVD